MTKKRTRVKGIPYAFVREQVARRDETEHAGEQRAVRWRLPREERVERAGNQVRQHRLLSETQLLLNAASAA